MKHELKWLEKSTFNLQKQGVDVLLVKEGHDKVTFTTTTHETKLCDQSLSLREARIWLYAFVRGIDSQRIDSREYVEPYLAG